MISHLRENRGGRNTLRKVEKMMARGWRPGLTVREVLARRHPKGGQNVTA